MTRIRLSDSTAAWVRKSTNLTDAERAIIGAIKYRRVIKFWEYCRRLISQRRLAYLLGVSQRQVRRLGYALELAGLIEIKTIYKLKIGRSGGFLKGQRSTSVLYQRRKYGKRKSKNR